MNLIFLDIDGVLNSVESMMRKKQERDCAPIEGANREDRDDWPDETLVARLNRLIHETESCVVISSTWRYMGFKKVKHFLIHCGIPEPVIIGATPIMPGTRRGRQIQQWMDDNYIQMREFDKFIILDDDSDMLHLMPYLIQTKNAVGLQDADVDRAIRILKG
jgi:hypothetical protein